MTNFEDVIVPLHVVFHVPDREHTTIATGSSPHKAAIGAEFFA